MSKFFKSKIFITLVIITVVIGILMAVSTIGAGSTNPVVGALGFVTTPVSNFLNYAGGGVVDFFGDLWQFREYKEKYEQADAELKKLQQSSREADTLKNENERLKKLLELYEKADGSIKVAAQVAAVNPTNWYEDVIINKGTSSGITIGSAVISTDGLVGHISEAGPNWSKVVTILDTDSSAGCTTPRSGDVAVIEGDETLADSGECAMNYISKDATVAVGDSVETSSISSIYPSGILIGKVSAVMPDSQGFYNKATVKTAVDFRKLREVIVIVSGEGA